MRVALRSRVDPVFFEHVGYRAAPNRRSRDGLDRLARYRTAVFPLIAYRLVSSLGTPWGLFRHYWVRVKLLITVPAILVLLMHMQPIGRLADVAAKRIVNLPGADLHGIRSQLVAATTAALLVLLMLTALSIYEPRGHDAVRVA